VVLKKEDHLSDAVVMEVEENSLRVALEATVVDSVMEGYWVAVDGIQQSVRVVVVAAANNRSAEPVAMEVVVSIHQADRAAVVAAVRSRQLAQEVREEVETVTAE